MQNRHEPDNEFVERLEWQIGQEVRRRNRSAHISRVGRSPRMKIALAAMVLTLVSMGIGAGAVAAAYQAQDSERREALTASLERRAEIVRQRLTYAAKQMEYVQQQISLGAATNEALLESRVKVAEAQSELRSIELLLEEVRITGRDPLLEMSSPLISGRDFVTERLRIELSAPEAALALAQARLRESERRLTLGLADELEVDASRARVLEAEVAIEALRKKTEIRSRFLQGAVNAVETEVRVLESEAEKRRRVLTRQVELVRKETERARQKLRLGTVNAVDLAESEVRLRERETELARAEYELALVRRRLERQ